MNNKSISDFVANSMNDALNSDEYKQLFGTQIKTASDENDVKEEVEEEVEELEEDSAEADDMGVEEEASPVYAVAIDSLLTASAALDALNMGRGATLSLKLAELVLAAKKKDSEDKEEKDSKKEEKGSKKEEKDSKKKPPFAKKDTKETKEDKKSKKTSK